MLIGKKALRHYVGGKVGAWESQCVTVSVEKRKQYKSLDPSAGVRYLAKLLVLGPKEADDPFAAWNDTEQV